MNIYDNLLYLEDVHYVARLDLPWWKLKEKSILLSGATGLLGSFFIDVIMEKNHSEGLNCKVYAVGRNEKKAFLRFSNYKNIPYFDIIHYDVKEPLMRKDIGIVDYVLHLASNTHPMQYSTDPIGTISTNVIGLMNMLDFAIDHHATRFIFASSNEIYGENRGDVEFFDENYCGYINSNTMRAGYPESKRCGETLCYSYAYIADAISGLLTVMLKGENGEAYNIADKMSDIMLKDLAAIIAEINKKKVVFEIPDAVEAAGYSRATKARLNGKKLMQLGWKPKYDIKSGLERTIRILKEIG